MCKTLFGLGRAAGGSWRTSRAIKKRCGRPETVGPSLFRPQPRALAASSKSILGAQGGDEGEPLQGTQTHGPRGTISGGLA